MALSQSSLAFKIENAIKSAFSIPSNPQLHTFANAIAGAIVDEITSNGEVDIGISLTATGQDSQSFTVNSTGETTSKGKIL